MERRTFIAGSASALLASFAPQVAHTQPAGMLTRPVPSSGENVPVIGMGTWITFNVGNSEALRQSRLEILRTFFELGGGVVDSSPMYGTAQDVLGWCLQRLPANSSRNLVSATKIWTPAGGNGPEQMADARTLWGLPKIDIMQVHNLVDWQDHLKAIREARERGLVRYTGVTTSHGSRHDRLADIMQTEPLDLIQLTYNVLDRKPESRLLPMAADKGIGVIVNRPFQRGSLIDRLESEPLPGWAADYGIANWPQFLLKFIISHPAVTCAIPATSQVGHMRENMAAMHGPMPDAATRRKMLDYVEAL